MAPKTEGIVVFKSLAILGTDCPNSIPKEYRGQSLK